MANFKSQQRVRLNNGTTDFGFVNTNGVWVRLTDGTNNAVITAAGEVKVSITSGGSPSKADDSAFTIGTDNVSPSGFLIDETATDSGDEGDVVLARCTPDRKVLVRIAGATDANRWDITAGGLGKISLDAITVTAVPVSATTALNSETNPIWVSISEGALSGGEVHSSQSSTAVATDASANLDYTVTAAKTLKLRKVWVSGSGSAHFELKTGPVATLTTVGFKFTSASHPSEDFDLPIAKEVPSTSTGTARIVATNDDNQAQDLFCTFIGVES